MHSRPKSEPWLNDTTHAVRRECRKAERKWKKDKLQVSFEILEDSWCNYQKTVKEEKAKYFSNIISNSCHNTHVLFNTINTVLNTSPSACPDLSLENCEKFLHFFKDITIIRAHISPPSYDPSTAVTCSAVFEQFEPVSLSQLKEIIGHMKSSTYPTNVVPPCFFKEICETIGPNIQTIINSSLASGVVPATFTHAVVCNH